ncbi:S-adenosyl-L-methionine-dependent methyltransferase [Dactylonectria macrodidyma]|uniref:S-adenosyl-L-methionine-dependent methyltransferase n=1 Tax=Dactylonectria macrodidyma TaxID=307937 RepID=A0A9P9EQQ0_9HYPO|nr:S-adenosyl-L-methionine-dependent methyltransferase [Dactylonectria macrodidyma]
MAGESPRNDQEPTPSPKSSPARPALPEQVIEADDAPDSDDDADSTLENDVESSTASITSSILHYRTIQGRTYHSERGNASYWGSNDDRQSEAMDIAHHMWTLAQDGKIHMAPLEPDIQKALDIGCGTGMWAVDFADDYPSCEVIGTDISPIQPVWTPPNLKFEIDDCTQDWTFSPGTFDYIHIRYLIGCIPDWGELFKQSYKTLKPGGWLESFEASPTIESDDGTVTPTSALGRWGPIFIDGSKKSGRTFTVIADGLQRKYMEEAGFVDIQEWDFKCPLSPWPKDPKMKEIGQYGELFATQDTEGFVLFVMNLLGWSHEEIQVYIAHVRREIRNRKNHPYFRLKTVWGRKPENP